MRCVVERDLSNYHLGLSKWEEYIDKMEEQGEDVENLTEEDMIEHEKIMKEDRASERRDIWDG